MAGAESKQRLAAWIFGHRIEETVMKIWVRISWFSLLGLALLALQPAQAQLYKWTDENGKVHFTDKPPKQLKKEPQVVKIAPKKRSATTSLRLRCA